MSGRNSVTCGEYSDGLIATWIGALANERKCLPRSKVFIGINGRGQPNAGLLWGAYHFLRPVSISAPAFHRTRANKFS
jgi:hypothetical protein